jgi:very-short-patch-repair endonuclease
MRDQLDKPDALMAQIASRQHGVVSVAQLRHAGLDKDRVRRRVVNGRLHRLHRGVYAVGHRSLPIEARWMAAVLACGEGAVLSHRSAASLWGLLDPKSGSVDVSIPGTPGRGRRAGIRLHRCQSLASDLTTRRLGIPVTAPARTITDLRRMVSSAEYRRAIRQSAVLGLNVGPDIAQDGTRSELEWRFLLLCRNHRLPPPEVNVRIAGLLVDFVWRDQRLIVETDGYKFHRGRAAFEDDRGRDLRLRQIGFDVMHFSYRQVVDQPEQVVSVLRKELSGSPPAQTPP